MDERADDRHIVLMRAVLDRIGREHLLLKGGTALMFGYEVPRVSDDLDFDAPFKVRNIEKNLRTLNVPGVTVISIDTLKNTDTLTRYRIKYRNDDGTETKPLKIEISYRQAFDEDNDVTIIDGIRFASLPRIIDQKLLAAHDGDHTRTKARDLFDLDFIATKYPDAFRPDLAARLVEFAREPGDLHQRYEEAFADSGIDITPGEIEEMVLRLHENATKIERSLRSPSVEPINGETTIALLCKFAEIEHIGTIESQIIRLAEGTGHGRTITSAGDMPPLLTIDMTIVPKIEDKQRRAIEVLTIAAVNLQSEEAAETLAQLGLVKQNADGRYVRMERHQKLAGER